MIIYGCFSVGVAHSLVRHWAHGVTQATHSLSSELRTGVLWVSTATHPCGPPPKQDGGGTRAPALRTLDEYVLHVQGDVEYVDVLLHYLFLFLVPCHRICLSLLFFFLSFSFRFSFAFLFVVFFFFQTNSSFRSLRSIFVFPILTLFFFGLRCCIFAFINIVFSFSDNFKN